MPKPSITIYTLPGFLGLPSDWTKALVGLEDINLVHCNLYDSQLPLPRDGMELWAQSFNSMIRESNQGKHRNNNNILLGYSLGGRLGMHAILQDPSLWNAAVIVSSHPGLNDPLEKMRRKETDQKWIYKFLTQSWDELMEDWNNQSVFDNNLYNMDRDERNYQRSLLAETLHYWSLSAQKDLKPSIESLEIPMLWMAGEHDTRYSTIAKNTKLKHPFSKVAIIPQSTHRVPWDATKNFQSELKRFLKAYQLNN